MKKIIVFGANGLLGSSLTPYLSTSGFQVFTAGRDKSCDYCIDALKISDVNNLFEHIHPDHVINLIAATNVDECENDVELATKVNALIPSNISRAASREHNGSSIIHVLQVSTDQVYIGTGNHLESDVNPINVYGLSKLAGELMMDAKSTLILRTNFFGKSLSNNRYSFSDWIVRSLSSNLQITLFQDVKFSPLHISSLCSIIKKMLEMRLIGTFNLGSRKGISKSDFAYTLAKETGLATSSAKLGSLADIELKAKRPRDMTLNVRALEQALGIRCPDIHEEIYKAAKEYAIV